tara:strand:- start:1066 stop:1551 length:486 start_codon:yes stop_codon:yes gene_type:complete
MAKPITIQNKVIQFPESAESPNWAPAMVAFAEAVEAALATLTGVYDVPPQVFSILSDVNASQVDITPLAFPPASVSRVDIIYSVIRSSDTPALASEGGTIQLFYHGTTGWDMTVTKQNDAGINFFISADSIGQISYTTPTGIGGSGFSGLISFKAIAILDS